MLLLFVVGRRGGSLARRRAPIEHANAFAVLLEPHPKVQPFALEKIGELLGVTRERIRQIRERAFEKLRESPEGNALAGFWNVA